MHCGILLQPTRQNHRQRVVSFQGIHLFLHLNRPSREPVGLSSSNAFPHCQVNFLRHKIVLVFLHLTVGVYMKCLIIAHKHLKSY